MTRMIDGYQLLLGMDSINKIGSVTLRKGEVIFRSVAKVEAQRLSCVEAQDKEPLINVESQSRPCIVVKEKKIWRNLTETVCLCRGIRSSLHQLVFVTKRQFIVSKATL